MGLFKPMWMSRDEGIAAKGIAKVDDEATLRRIVQEARHGSNRLYAARKLSNKGMGSDEYWHELALSHGDRDVRILAADKIDDMDFLGDFLESSENLGPDGKPNSELSQKRNRILNKMNFDGAVEFMRETENINDCALLVQIATMDDAAVEERFGKSNLGKIGVLPRVRERALVRLSVLQPDKAYLMLTRNIGVDERVALHIVGDIEDNQLLYRIASDDKARCAVRVKAVGSTWFGKRESCDGIADIDYLGKLANLPRKTFNDNHEEFQGDEKVREAAARKMCNLPCRNGQYHNWQIVEENIREVGEHYYGMRRYRCSTCGNEYVEHVSERF